MNEFILLIKQPWPWYISGPIISLVLLSLLLSGKSFGISANLRSMCSILGAGKSCEFFDFNWKSQIWNLIFALGMVLGGLLSRYFLTEGNTIGISLHTIEELTSYGITNPGSSISPEALFSWSSLRTLSGFTMLVIGGFFVGFGTRYAGGCTSGHAISGLSDLQLPSLIAVIGFFIGGLIATYAILPFLLSN